MKTVTLNETEIIKRGYVTVDEWQHISALNKYTKYIARASNGATEKFFAFVLASRPNTIVLCNDLRMFQCPTSGLVAELTNGEITGKDCTKQWAKSGPAFIKSLIEYLQDNPEDQTAKLLLGNTSAWSAKPVR